MEENKKIKNATEIEYNGIIFRSKKELEIYKHLLSKNITPEYEPMSIKIWDREKFSVPYYDRYGKRFMRITRKPTRVSYTPDFIFEYGIYKVILEVKGFKNDVAPYKIRMFRDWLEGTQCMCTSKYCYAVVYSKKDVDFLLTDLDNTM